jgi:hypothetical protein
LTEFEKVFALANETSTLGSTFLGMNQGLPTTKLDLQKKILKITKSVSDREKALFTVTATYESGDNKVSKTSTHTIEKASFFDFTVK